MSDAPHSRGAPPKPPVDALIGSTIKQRYTVVAFVGEGTFGRVYRAVDSSSDVDVALKLIDLGNEFAKEIRERVRREAAALARVPSDHVVRLVDFFEYKNQLAILMEFAPGRTLDNVLRKREALDLKTAIDVLRQIAAGLSAVHDKGLIHRDLKPENILLETTRDGSYFVRIIDLGVAHVMSDARITQGFIGTPKYACPEQITEAKLTPRSDIYALGLIAYEILAGRSPFDGASLLAVLNQQVNHPAPRLEWPGIGDADDWEKLSSLVAQMLEKSPQDRPATMADVLAELTVIADGSSLAIETSLAEISMSEEVPESDNEFSRNSTGSAVFQPFDESREAWSLTDLSEASNVAYSEGARTVKLFSNQSSEVLATYELSSKLVSICIDGQSAILGFEDHVELVDLQSATASRLIETDGDSPQAVDLCVTRRTCAVGFESGRVAVLRDIPMVNVDVSFQLTNPVASVKLDREARTLAVATTANLWLYGVPRKRFEKRWKFPISGRVVDLAFSRDGYLVAALFDDGRIDILSTVNATPVTSSPPSEVGAIEFSESGDLITLQTSQSTLI